MLCQLSEGSVTIYSRIAGNAPETTDAARNIKLEQKLKGVLLQVSLIVKNNCRHVQSSFCSHVCGRVAFLPFRFGKCHLLSSFVLLLNTWRMELLTSFKRYLHVA